MKHVPLSDGRETLFGLFARMSDRVRGIGEYEGPSSLINIEHLESCWS
jgi:hypothetical protein